MKNYSGFIAWRKLYSFRIEFLLMILVTVIYAAIFLILGHIPKINEIILFNDTDVIHGKVFWDLPKVIHLPWEISSLLEIPIIFVIIVSPTLAFRFLTNLHNKDVKYGGYFTASVFLIFIAMWIGSAAAGGTALGSDLAGRNFNGLQAFIKFGGGAALCFSLLGGLNLAGVFDPKNLLDQYKINSYIKIASSILVFSIMTIILILLVNVGLMTFVNPILLSVLGVILIFSLGTIIGIIFGFILKYSWFLCDRLFNMLIKKNNLSI